MMLPTNNVSGRSGYPQVTDDRCDVTGEHDDVIGRSGSQAMTKYCRDVSDDRCDSGPSTGFQQISSDCCDVTDVQYHVIDRSISQHVADDSDCCGVSDKIDNLQIRNGRCDDNNDGRSNVCGGNTSLQIADAYSDVTDNSFDADECGDVSDRQNDVTYNCVDRC